MSNLLTTFDEKETLEVIKEAREGGRSVIKMRGIIQKANTLNQNGRIYPKEILEREVRNYQKFIAERRALGELDHPDSSVINLKNVSHLMTEVYFQGDVVYGQLEVLSTPSGQIVQSLIADKVKIGISSRGIGSTEKKGDYHVVQDDFQIIAFDLVCDPSTPQAFMIPEGKQLKLSEINKTFNKTDNINRIINDILMLK